MTEKPDQQGYNEADNDHRCNGKIKGKIVPFYDDVTWQSAEGQGAEPGPGQTD